MACSTQVAPAPEYGQTSPGVEDATTGPQQHAATSPTSSRVSFACNSDKTTTVDACPPPPPALLVQRQKLRCLGEINKTGTADEQHHHFAFSSDKRRKKFQVHSRRRSIWKLSEFEGEIEKRDTQEIEPQQRSSSFGQQYKAQTLSQSYSAFKLPTGSNEQPTIGLQSVGASNPEREEHETMSQTLQSIQSLSMQLNRAASLSGSTQLDDLMDSTGGASPQRQNQESTALELGQSSRLTRLVGKKAARVKEILLQNLGKADKTTDELFKIYEENFYKQQAQAAKLQKEFKSYIQALKGAQDAGKSLHYFIQQSTIDYQSARHDLVCENLSQLEHLNEDLMDKLRGQVLISVNEYLTQFKELRVKIAKRRRKQIDFDSSRRVYELALAAVNKKRIQQQQVASQVNLQQTPAAARSGFRSSFFPLSQPGNGSEEGIQSATSQLVDEARLLKLREQYNYCKIMYETINSELHEELPMVYEKKMKNLLMTLQNYFSLEAQFHSNAGKLFATSSDVIDDIPPSHHHNQQQQQHSHPHSLDHHHHLMHMNHHHHLDHHHHLSSSSSAEEEYASHEGAVGNKAASAGGSTSGMGSSGADSSLSESDGANSETHSGSPDVACDEQVDAPGESGEREEKADDEQAPLVVASEQVEVREQEQGEVAPTIDSNQANPGKESTEVDDKEQLPQQGNYCEDSAPVPDATAQAADDANARMDSNCQQEKSVDGSVGHEEEQVIAPQVPIAGAKKAVQVEAKEKSAKIEIQTEAEEKVVECGNSSNEEQEQEQTMTVARCLHKVKTNYKYLAEDVDELCFEADEIIQVVEFDAGQDQEEGWLMGVREVNGQRGLFPANFTRPHVDA